MYSEYRQDRMLRHHSTPRKPAICNQRKQGGVKILVFPNAEVDVKPASLPSHLKQVLVRQVVSRVDLKDEHVVDAGLPPPVRVDAQEEDELDQQEAAPVDAHHRPHVLEAHEHHT